MLSLKCPFSAANSVTFKGLCSNRSLFLFQDLQLEAAAFSGRAMEPWQGAGAHCLLYAIPQSCTWLYPAPAAVVDSIPERRFNSW